MPESPRDLRKTVHDTNEAIRAHANGRSIWTELDRQRHSGLVDEWLKAVAELRASEREDDEAGPAAA